MSELSSISNILYSNNPFLIKKISEYLDAENDKIRKTIINVKYWYSSMPDECKSIFLKVIENKVFTIHKGIYLTAAPNSVVDLLSRSPEYKSKKKVVASSFSDAIEIKDSQISIMENYGGFSLVDSVNNFVFFSTPYELNVLDKHGNQTLSLITHNQHALLVYAAIRGVSNMLNNIKKLEDMRAEDDLRNKILEVYNVQKKS